jgi:hypothetical protein
MIALSTGLEVSYLINLLLVAKYKRLVRKPQPSFARATASTRLKMDIGVNAVTSKLYAIVLVPLDAY